MEGYSFREKLRNFLIGFDVLVYLVGIIILAEVIGAILIFGAFIFLISIINNY